MVYRQKATQLSLESLSLIHISEPTRRRGISYAVFCLKKKKTNIKHYTDYQRESNTKFTTTSQDLQYYIYK
ncbi:hypothetical protein AMBR_NBBOBCOC_02852 [Lacticaseibacillus rhamnosus]|nr:hypothetical protein AMBR_NBBOBCOC_02852 [Lacticaseibacillus rhamnosus]